MKFSAVTVFCEDIREEKGGTDTLVGLLTDNLNLQGMTEPPSGLPSGSIPVPGIPKLGIYTRVVVPADTKLKLIVAFFTLPSGKESVIGEFDANLIEKATAEARSFGSPICTLLGKTVVAPLLIRSPGGRFLVTVRAGGEEIIAGTLNIMFAGPATASPPPPSQSPSDAS